MRRVTTRWVPTGAWVLVGAAACALLTTSFTATAAAGPKAQPVGRSAQQRGATDARLATRDLWKLAWHGDWKAAVLANRLQRKDARPIFHLRILGDLAAKT